METSAPGVFACGNVVHVNDLVDNVTVESLTAGKYAALYAKGALPACEKAVPTVPGENVRYICPQVLHIGGENEPVRLNFRVARPAMDVVLTAESGGKEIARRRERRVNPGEMCHLDIETGAVEGDSVVIRVVTQ
jgi:hypothetical protein